MARMDPHLILYIFLPTLIFESAFVMNVHVFKRMTPQIVLLAGPGMLIGACILGLSLILTIFGAWYLSSTPHRTHRMLKAHLSPVLPIR